MATGSCSCPSTELTKGMRKLLEELRHPAVTISPVTPASMILVARLKSAGLVQMSQIVNGYEISPAGRKALKDS